MYHNIFIALVVVLVNMVLSSIVPCLIKRSDQPLMNDIKKVFTNNKHIILLNSIIIGVIVYISLLIAPTIQYNLLKLNKLFDSHDSVYNSDLKGLKNVLRLYRH